MSNGSPPDTPRNRGNAESAATEAGDGPSGAAEGADFSLFGDRNFDRLCGLVFELAGALHVERQQRMALEEILVRRQVVSREEIAALVSDKDFRAKAQGELDDSIARLMRVISEQGSPQGPLRAEMLGDDPL